ncbi:TPA: type 1 fimbria D-mannose specific adhesin FimH [Enterobacter cancerogenus]|nr:type 1 fimbria D-mannose specific adhesin FimH [Enterobacter cancerogenus]MRG30431.1 type 1 fimbrin D-mannose specific adhesin FimH [Enterobacter cancerogenus]QGG09230.1 type 1 fimbrin D-mannose specific adhesin FimH [Enterobacter cancerogenus]QZY37958.1 type 1 fimbria D-mannose specific adhesin FimH [Enterobacter cancerogenus]CAD5353360.1 putative fimbrial-like adhesin protein [Enterobacter cancerogenus]
MIDKRTIRRGLLALVLVSLPATHALATVCVNENGVPTDIFYDLTDTFNSSNNQVGQIVTLGQKSQWVGVNAVCPKGTTGNTTKRSYVTRFTPTATIDGYKYLKLNDYLDGAMKITDSYAGPFYPPQNYIQMGSHPNVSKNKPFAVKDSNLVFRLKVTRRFINMVEIPRETMFSVYVTTSSSDPINGTPVYTISYSGTIQVPQSCAINAGQIVEFDFGDIGASLFSQAGAGNRPQKVSPQSKTVAIKCTNVEANAYLTMRIEADSGSVNGNMLVSDNKDVGFIIANDSGTPLTPNSLSSKIPFRLDDNAQAQVGIRAWPVSVTGNKPAEGRFTSRGYLRVDYD